MADVGKLAYLLCVLFFIYPPNTISFMKKLQFLVLSEKAKNLATKAKSTPTAKMAHICTLTQKSDLK